MNIEAIKEAIKKAKWDKHMYAYAIGAMDIHSTCSLWPDSYRKAELIERFYKLCETRFDKIANFTTFKHLKTA